MNSMELFRIGVRVLWLPKSLDTYLDYLRVWSAIVFDGNRLLRYLIYLALAILAYHSVKYFYLNTGKHTELERILLCDTFYLMARKDGTDYLVSSCCVMVAVHFWLYYLRGDPANNAEFYKIVFQQKTDYFLCYVMPNGESIYVYVRRYALRLLNAFQIFTLILYCFIPYGIWFMINLYCQHGGDIHPPDHPWLGRLNIAWGVINIVLGAIGLLTFLHTVTLFPSMGMVMTKYALIKFRQITDTVASPSRFRPADIYRFHRHWSGSLIYIIKGNVIYGRVFLSFMICQCPINLRSVMLILFGRLETPQMVFLLILVVGELVGIFGIHYILALYIRAVHRPAKCLTRIMLANLHRVADLRAKIRLAYCIEMLHTDNKYGITYGQFGLVTIKTFGKFVVLYGKFLLITYKLQRRLDSESDS